MFDALSFTYINSNFCGFSYHFYKENLYTKKPSTENILSFLSVKSLKEALKKEKFFGYVESIGGYPLLKIQEEIFSIFSKNQFICNDFFTFFMVETSLFDENESVFDFLKYYFSTKQLLKDTKAETITLNDMKEKTLDSKKQEKLCACISKILKYPITIPFKIEETYFDGNLTIYEFVKRKKAQQNQKEKSHADKITLTTLLKILEKTNGYYALEDKISGVFISDIDLYIRLSLPDTINTYSNLYAFLLIVSSSLDRYLTIEEFCNQYKKELALEKISQAEVITGKKALLWIDHPDKKQTLDWLFQYINLFFLSVPLTFSSLGDFLNNFDEEKKELPISYLVQLKKSELSKKYETIPLYEIKNAFDRKERQIQGIPFEHIHQYLQLRLRKYGISLTFEDLIQREIYYVSSDLSLSEFFNYYIETNEMEKQVGAEKIKMEKIFSTCKDYPNDPFLNEIDSYFSYRLKKAGVGGYSHFSLFLNSVKKEKDLSVKEFIERYIDQVFTNSIDFSLKKDLQPMIRETLKLHEQYYPKTIFQENQNVYKLKPQKEAP